MSAGFIHVITGPMKCGKSEEILRLIKRFKIAERNVLIVKPDIDRRFGEDKVMSRDDHAAECYVVPSGNPDYILTLVDNTTDVIVIDEAQFFEPAQYIVEENCVYLQRSDKKTITDVVQELCDMGYHVIVAGLDMTSDRKPFREMPNLMSIAHKVDKLQAVCECCKKDGAIYSYANFEKKDEVTLGDREYIAVCPDCYIKIKAGKKNK